MTDRDEEILKFINNFGFVGLKHVMHQFNLMESNGYKILKRLMRAGLINHERIYHNKKGVYYVSAKGAEWSNLLPLKNVSESRYKHHLKVIDIYLLLQRKYPNACWVSERSIIKAEYKKRKDWKKHLPDGYLLFPDQRKIAIEVELTLKEEARLFQIFKYYGGHDVIDEAWYYCAPDIINSLRVLVKNKPYIKIHSLEGLDNE